MNSTTTRRGFLKTGITLAALPYFVPARALGAGGTTAPSEKIVLGCIGVGSMGGGHVRGWLGHEDVQLAAVATFASPSGRRPSWPSTGSTATRTVRPTTTFGAVGPAGYRRGLCRDARPLARSDRH